MDILRLFSEADSEQSYIFSLTKSANRSIVTCAERAEDLYAKYTLFLLSWLLSFFLKLCIVVACFKAFKLRLKNQSEDVAEWNIICWRYVQVFSSYGQFIWFWQKSGRQSLIGIFDALYFDRR